MMNSKVINVVWVALLAVASLAYLSLVASYIPSRYALLVNFMLVPLVFGFAGYLLIQGTWIVKLILLAILPAVHILCFGADKAKPGLENMVAAGEYFFICIGTILSYVVKRSLRHPQL